MKQYKFVDLFAGCGGLSLGLQQAGFTPWFVNEIVEQFCNTYKFNHDLSDDTILWEILRNSIYILKNTRICYQI